MEKWISYLFSLTSIFCISESGLNAQDDVLIGKSRKYNSGFLGGEVTYLVHLPGGYETSGKNYPVVYIMTGQSISSFANAAATLDNLSVERIPDMILVGFSYTGLKASPILCPDESGNIKTGIDFYRFLT